MEKAKWKDWFNQSKSLELRLQRARVTSDDRELTDDDKSRVAHAYVIWATLAYDMADRFDATRTVSPANLTRWLDQLVLRDVAQTADTLKRALSAYRQVLAKRTRSPKKLHYFFRENAVDTALLGPSVELIYRSVQGGPADYELVREVNTFLQFITRLTLRDNSYLEEVAASDYLVFEESMATWCYSDAQMEQLRWAVNELFGSWSLDAVPRFSNGATSEVKRGRGVEKKLKCSLTWGARQFLDRAECDSFAHVASPPRDVNSRWQSVPKGINKRRSICMEPTYNQYCQQALFRSFDKYCCEHPKTRVTLHSQERNRELAQIGSLNGYYSTIDLSDASDSVSLELVKRVCRDLPVYSYLIRCRTPYCEIAGQRIQLKKFAPMGSACCFPIECLIFSSIVYLAMALTGIYGFYSVYGDDIVVPSQLAPTVIELLEAFHFRVNREKTFVFSQFTESCGIECLDGHDISPIRLGRRFDVVSMRRKDRRGLAKSPQAYLGFIDQVNQFFGTSFIMTRKRLISDLLGIYPKTYFCEYDQEYGIKSLNPTNGHLVCRSGFSARDLRVDGRHSTAFRYQRLEWYTYLPVSCVENGDDYLRYEYTLWNYQERPFELVSDEFNSQQYKVGESSIRLRYVWYPGWLTPNQIDLIREIRGQTRG